MSTILPSAPGERRIIPLRPATAFDPAARTAEGHAGAGMPDSSPRQTDAAARHYLKFMLPSIPVAAFILTFLLCDVLLGMQSAALASAAHVLAPPTNPALPLAAALIVSATTGALCMWIYFGYLRIAHRPASTHA